MTDRPPIKTHTYANWDNWHYKYLGLPDNKLAHWQIKQAGSIWAHWPLIHLAIHYQKTRPIATTPSLLAIKQLGLLASKTRQSGLLPGKNRLRWPLKQQIGALQMMNPDGKKTYSKTRSSQEGKIGIYAWFVGTGCQKKKN